MAIFSRRTLQRLINENAAFVEPQKLKQHIDNLNNIDPEQYLSYEWEVVILNIFNKVGRLEHETNFEGKTPDIYFQSYDDNLAFIGEISTVSDKHLKEQNPLDYFQEKFEKEIEKNKLELGLFYVKIGGNNGKDFLKEKRKLKLPKKENMYNTIFKNPDFVNFLSAIRRQPQLQHQFILKDLDIDLQINYNLQSHLKENLFGMAYPSYRNIYFSDMDFSKQNPTLAILKQNVVYKRLDEKCKYLTKIKKKGNLNSLLGVVLCDGGCESLHHLGINSRNLGDIMNICFDYNRSIDFVLVVTVSRNVSSPNIVANFYPNPFSKKLINDKLYGIINQAVKQCPMPQSNADSAIGNLKIKYDKGHSFHGGLTLVPGNGYYQRVTISARSLLELLAGELKQQKFFKDHHFIENNELHLYQRSPVNPFKVNLDKGILIESISIEKYLDRDDDRVTFSFPKETFSYTAWRTTINADKTEENDRKIPCQEEKSYNISCKNTIVIDDKENEACSKLMLPTKIFLELLAGRLDQETFLKYLKSQHSISDQVISQNIFQENIRQGRLIEEMKINNDFMTIYFSKPDPAISPFVMPILT
jgi:hypothetical protein